MIFRYRTCIPLTVKYGISNLTPMGAFHEFSPPFFPSFPCPPASAALMEGRPKCALIRYSLPPWNCLMFQTTASRSGRYVTFPTLDLNEGLSTSGGTGMMISTLLATLRDLNWDRVLIMYSILDPLCGSTTASTQMRGFTWVLRRYVIRSNSPSGGMKDMVLSFSNRASRTHWWNLMSSNSTAFPARAMFCRPVASNMSLSLSPSFSSGIPDRKDFILTAPRISECRTVPLAATSRLSFSTTSRKISFFLCLMPSARHDTAFVRATGGLDLASSAVRLPSWVMKERRMVESRNWGRPWSMVSSRSSYMHTKLSRMDSSSRVPK
mmetsp:Transcript_28945/g.59240  ORF Transcript_28945/g.59240 Transcript_28945/m.59240 type:complete len:323 (+) Transcript_28945:541-1509(+)